MSVFISLLAACGSSWFSGRRWERESLQKAGWAGFLWVLWWEASACHGSQRKLERKPGQLGSNLHAENTSQDSGKTLPFPFLPNLRSLPAAQQIITAMEEPLWKNKGSLEVKSLDNTKILQGLRGWRRREGSRKRRCISLTQLIPNAVSNLNTLVRRYYSSLGFTER